jgi:predicted NBD/HSP70 family sugar kinase
MLPLIPPTVAPPLDPDFRPAALANRAFRQAVRDSGDATPLRIAVERARGVVSVYETEVFREGSPRFGQNLAYVERLVKLLLWARGGWRVTIGGPSAIGEHIKRTYAPGGARAFDCRFMGDEVYEKPFQVDATSHDSAPAERESSTAIGRHLDGCRIGLDLGGTDRKACALVDGEPAWTEEVIWHPKTNPDSQYHVEGITAGLRAAAAHLPKVDAIGVSAAGIYVDNRVMVASLFRRVPRAEFNSTIKVLFVRIAEQWGVPVEVANDGDVAALAGAMSLRRNGVLGIAMGTSEAGGYVNKEGNITGWLNELAFVPLDYSPTAPVDDEWSGDTGCGVQYFSQAAVVRLCPRAGLAPGGDDDGERLAAVQGLAQQGDRRAIRVFETIGVYFGYALAHYAEFYDAREVLVLGRVTSGVAGDILVDRARHVLATDFPTLASTLQVRLPDEKSKRVGQAVAAASLPELRR